MRSRGLAVALLGLVTALPGPIAAAAGEAGGYRLGPQDKLDIRVYDVRAGSGEAHQWIALNGEFFVDATGAVSLPLLGEVPAGGGTVGDLADAIATRLQSKIGLAQRPDASVQVIKYRPFFILGAVETPGAYDYRPGLTVLQAVSTASGMARTKDVDLIGLERDDLTQRGEARVLEADRLALAVRQVRLDAEIADADTLVFPPDLRVRASDPDMARAMREETALFASRRNTLKSQVDAINRAKALLTSELTSLAAKDATLGRQLDLSRKELAQITDLVNKGLTVVPRQLAAEQSAAAFESSRLDVQLATLRAQQDLSKADRDVIDLHANYRNEALTEAAEVRTKLAADIEKVQTARQLVFEAEVRAPLSAARDATAPEPTYLLTRGRGDAARTAPASENDAVEPGDVVRVTLPRPAPGESPEVAAAPGTEAADASRDRPIRR